MAKAINGAGEIEIPGGRTVGRIKEAVGQVLNVSPEAAALVNGHPVQQQHVVQDEDSLEFIRASGRKGVGEHVWDGEEFCRSFKVTPEDLQAWIGQGLRCKRCLDGSIRITETAVDEFFRGRVIGSPYLNTEQAAAYCNVTKDAFYGRVERRKIRPLPGSGNENLFTREQCDQMMRGE